MRVARRGDYRFGAPYGSLSFAVSAIFSFSVTVVCFAWSGFWLAGLSVAMGVLVVLSTSSFVWTTRRGRFEVWAELLDALALWGDERVLDVGCGGGAVLTLAAERLPAGRAVGIDLRSATDQSGNSEQVTILNANREGVRERVVLHTGDMRKLPFRD